MSKPYPDASPPSYIYDNSNPPQPHFAHPSNEQPPQYPYLPNKHLAKPHFSSTHFTRPPSPYHVQLPTRLRPSHHTKPLLPILNPKNISYPLPQLPWPHFFMTATNALLTNQLRQRNDIYATSLIHTPHHPHVLPHTQLQDFHTKTLFPIYKHK